MRTALSRTVDILHTEGFDHSDEEAHQSNLVYHSVAHKLPKPNPLFLDDALPRPFLHTETKSVEYYQLLSQEFSPKEDTKSSLERYVKNLPLLYQKYEPSTDQFYATYFLKPNVPMPRWAVRNYGDSVRFDSDFQSGNLFQVFQKTENEFILLLQNDVNTKGYNQWFYFSVQSFTQRQIKMSIININKHMKLYESGMKICVKENETWRKEALGLSFYRNNISRCESAYYFTLEFHYTFVNENKVYFAANYPYTYTDLQYYLSKQQPRYCSVMNVHPYALTDAQKECQVITITNPRSPLQKQCVLFIGRQHPGETASSFICEGLMDFLLSAEGMQLRENVCQFIFKYIFKIIPMLNIDGVICGNQRCSLQGHDLNRQWTNTEDPLIRATKRLISEIHHQTKIVILIDLHAHSRKYFQYQNRLNSFFYGQRLNTYIRTVCQLDSRVNMSQCRFMNPFKLIEQTARVGLSRLLNSQNVYTLETSYHGYQSAEKIIDFTIKDFKEIGRSLCKGLLLYKTVEEPQLEELRLEQLEQESQSDSEASHDEIQKEELKLAIVNGLSEVKPKISNSIPATICAKSPSVSSRKGNARFRINRSSQQRGSQQISHSYNFVMSNTVTCGFKQRKSSRILDEQTIPVCRSREFSAQPMMIIPQHSLKHQMLLLNRLKKQKQSILQQNSEKKGGPMLRVNRLIPNAVEACRKSHQSRKPLMSLNIY